MTPFAPFVSRHAPNGMVCAVDHLAAGAGVAMLRAGGTAADAAVAASAVLAVTTPNMCGMGGDLFALVHTGDGPPHTLNASGRSGSGADPVRARDEGLVQLPLRGDIRAVPVPGCVDGWLALHARFGRLDLGRVLEPAIAYARDGFPAAPLLVEAFPRLEGVAHLDDAFDPFPDAVGRRIRRPGNARALEAIVREGRAGFYEGEFGANLGVLGAGEYAPDDLRAPNAEWVVPLGARAWGHDLWTMPPNSQGYLALAGAWIAEGLDLPSDPDAVNFAHLLIEAAIQAGHDRPAVLHEHADGDALVAPARLAPRRGAIDVARAAHLAAPGAAGGTIALEAIDRDGTGVSLIQSNAAGFGAHLVVPGVGVFLQNRGLGFSLGAGHPAEYGPRRRPPHTLVPLVVTRPDGRLRALLGTMGADSQPQVLLQLLARVLLLGQSPAEALAAPRWVLASGVSTFSTWHDPDAIVVQVEAHAPAAWVPEFAREGPSGRRDRCLRLPDRARAHHRSGRDLLGSVGSARAHGRRSRLLSAAPARVRHASRIRCRPCTPRRPAAGRGAPAAGAERAGPR